MPNSDAAESARKGRVCLLTSNFPRWAGDSTTPFVLHLAQDLVGLGWEVDVLAPHAPGAARREVLDGIAVTRFRYLWPESQETVCYQGGALINLRKRPSNWLKLPALVFFEWLALMALLARGRYDLINAHWILPQGFVAVAAAWLFRKPVVTTGHGGDVFGLRGGLMSWFKRLALRRAAAITVNSSATETAVLELAPELRSIHRVPMGVSVPVSSTEADAATLRNRFRRGAGPLLVFVGRLVEEKGLSDLIRAVALLVADLPDATVMILGDGQERADMEALASQLDVSDRAHFLGWIESAAVPDYLAAADIFVGPSKRAADGWVEAQGLTFVEAMLARTPVIATRSGGIPDAVRHEDTGLLVPEGRPDDIAAAIRRLVADPPLACRVAYAGYALANSAFTRERCAGVFADLFDSLRVDSAEHR